MIELRFDDDLVHRMSAAIQHIRGGADTAAYRALRKTMASLRTEATRMARSAYTAKPQKLFAEIETSFSNGDGERWGKLTMRDRRGVSLWHFMPTPKNPTRKRPPGGVSNLVRRGGSRKVYGHDGQSKPFIMAKKQGGFGVFVRKQGGGRMDLTMLYGPSPIQSLQRDDSRERLETVGRELFEKHLRHEIEVIATGIVPVRGRK